MSGSDATSAETTHVDFDAIGAYQRYKLMASLIVPRPIALVTTVNAQGWSTPRRSACSPCWARIRRW
ncbi:hypothetical protein ACFSLT_29615 [Novosphingobium resinovorum]